MISLCVMMVTGGYLLLPIATRCDYPQCARVIGLVEGSLVENLPSNKRWIRIGPALACWAET